MRQIKVLVVEDSLVFRELLVKHLEADPAITVVAAVEDAFAARDAIAKYNPDVMTLDIELPKMNGIDFLRKLMPQHPMPVVVISSLSDKVFDALNAGAVEFVAKPVGTGKAQLEAFVKNELPVKIKIASIAKPGMKKRDKIILPKRRIVGADKDVIIAIGASTGGTEATATVLKEFGEDTPGIVVVQHMPPGFTKIYAERLNNQCKMTVKEAETGDAVVAGRVLIAPGGDAHMHLVKVNGVYQVAIRNGSRVNGHCPSVDVLFKSVAKTAGEKAIGIILTGMGGDGANGLMDMREAGARTIGQDESTCVVYGMPKVAYDLGAVEYQEKLSDIAKRTYSLLGQIT